MSDEVLLAAIGLVTVGVGGDTYRPSGMAKPTPTSVTTIDVTALPPSA